MDRLQSEITLWILILSLLSGYILWINAEGNLKNWLCTGFYTSGQAMSTISTYRNLSITLNPYCLCPRQECLATNSSLNFYMYSAQHFSSDKHAC